MIYKGPISGWHFFVQTKFQIHSLIGFYLRLQSFLQEHQSPLWGGPNAQKWRWAKSFWLGRGGIEGELQNFDVCVKVFYMLTLVWMKHLLQKEYLFWPVFLMSQYFCKFDILQFCKFSGFSQKKITLKTQNQNLIPDFLVYHLQK